MSELRKPISYVTLDLALPDVQTSLSVTQGDSTRRLVVTVQNKGEPFPLPKKWTAALTGVKPDENILYNSCVVDNTGRIIYDFAGGEEIATAVGDYAITFEIYDEAGDTVAAPSLWLSVKPSRIREVASDSQFTAAKEILRRLNVAEDNIDNIGNIPTFDLVELGMPTIELGGDSVNIETDTEKMLDATSKGPVKFIINIEYGGLVRNNAEVIVNKIGLYVSGIFRNFVLDFTIDNNVIGVLSQILQSALPTITDESEGHLLRVIDGKWAIDGEIPETVEELKSNVEDWMYKPISITKLTNDIGTVEKGTTVTEVNLSWAFSKKPTSLTLDGEAKEVDSNGETLTEQTIQSEKTWTLVATDERGHTAQSTTKINFYNGVYYGVADYQSSFDSSFITALGQSGTKILRSSKLESFNVTAAAGKHIYYCLPVSMGTCAFTVGGIDGGFDLAATIMYTNDTEGQHQENYRIYRSTNAGLGATTVGVK